MPDDQPRPLDANPAFFQRLAAAAARLEQRLGRRLGRSRTRQCFRPDSQSSRKTDGPQLSFLELPHRPLGLGASLGCPYASARFVLLLNSLTISKSRHAQVSHLLSGPTFLAGLGSPGLAPCRWHVAGGGAGCLPGKLLPCAAYS